MLDSVDGFRACAVRTLLLRGAKGRHLATEVRYVRYTVK